jgi:hypothetical protein
MFAEATQAITEIKAVAEITAVVEIKFVAVVEESRHLHRRHGFYAFI